MEPETLEAPSFWERLLRLVYPLKCMLCDCVLREDSALSLCDNCRIMLPGYGRGFEALPDMPCIEGLFAAFHYETGIDSAIQAMKFHNQPRLAATFGYLVWKELSKLRVLPDFEIVIPVPLHPGRQRQRGYNQSELLARELSARLNIPLETSILKKIRKTKPQSMLNRAERLENLKGAFELIDSRKIKDRVVLLVDDVVTTGTTLNTCAKILYENGAAWVYAAVIAIAGK